MKICKIIGDMTSENAAERYPVAILCDYCYQADAKRGDDAQVVSSEEYKSEFDVSCEACYKSLKEEMDETSPMTSD